MAGNSDRRDRIVTIAAAELRGRRVLVVDAELRITRLVRDYLRQAGFSVVEASDGPGALQAARDHALDAIVLDLGLPGMDGLDVTRELRAASNVPIIILTARTEESDRIVGLELGADDYVTKPFSPRELVARVGVVLRRARPRAVPETSSRVVLGDLAVDEERFEAFCHGVPLPLTTTEFRLLAALARRPGRVLSRPQLLDALRESLRLCAAARAGASSAPTSPGFIVKPFPRAI